MNYDVVKYVKRFKYLGFILQKNGFFKEDMNHRIKCGCMKWREASGILYDKSIPMRLKGQFYIA